LGAVLQHFRAVERYQKLLERLIFNAEAHSS